MERSGIRGIREIKAGFGIIFDGVPDNYRGKIMPKQYKKDMRSKLIVIIKQKH